jgi:hypothetical protein
LENELRGFSFEEKNRTPLKKVTLPIREKNGPEPFPISILLVGIENIRKRSKKGCLNWSRIK